MEKGRAWEQCLPQAKISSPFQVKSQEALQYRKSGLRVAWRKWWCISYPFDKCHGGLPHSRTCARLKEYKNENRLLLPSAWSQHSVPIKSLSLARLHFLSVQLIGWENLALAKYLTSLSLSFRFCKMGMHLFYRILCKMDEITKAALSTVLAMK